MKTILLVTLTIYLRSSATGDSKINCNLSNYNLMYKEEQSACEVEAELMVTCINKTGLNEATIKPKSICCNTKPVEDTSTTATNATHREMTTQPICKCQVAGGVASIGLGAAVGLLVVLLAIVTTGWMWTCWTMKRRGRITTNSRDIRECVTSVNNFDLSSNPSYQVGNQQTIQNYPLPTPTPTYETIPPLNNFMDGIKLDLVETIEEGLDVSNNKEEAYHKLNRAQRDDKQRESKDQTHKSGQMHGQQEKERVPDSSSGTGPLQEIQHSSANTSTECLLNSVVSGEEERSVSIGKKSQENETENSSIKKNDKEIDETTLEHNHDQEETSNKEQDLPKKRAIPRDYEQAVPSK